MGKKLLLIEDERGLVIALQDRLQAEGYVVDVATDGESGYSKASQDEYDLIVLDLMLPLKDGTEICRDLRAQRVDTPILMLTARNGLTDKVLGLKLGADDYLTKPFEMLELLARLEALSRRGAPRSSGSDVYRFDDVEIFFKKAEVYRQGRLLSLSAKEFMLLVFFVRNRDEVLSRNRILDDVWGYEAEVSTRTVDVHVAWLRQKLEKSPHVPRHFVTVRGLGYKYID